MKHAIGICSWSLQNNLDQVSRLLAEADLRHLHLDCSVVDLYRGPIAEHGWEVSCMMVHFPQEDYSTLESIRKTGGILPEECWPKNRELVLQAIKVTAEMGVPFLSTHVGFLDRNDAEGYATVCCRLAELADAAQQQGVTLLLETGQETAAELQHFLELLNHPALGVNFDPGNMVLYGKGDPIAAVGRLGPWIKHVHIKDATRSSDPEQWGTEVPWGEGDVPADAFLRALEAIHYTGPIVVEREAGDARAADIKTAVNRLRDIQ